MEIQDILSSLLSQILIYFVFPFIVFIIGYYFRDYLLKREGYANIETYFRITVLKKLEDVSLVSFRIKIHNIGKTRVDNRKYSQYQTKNYLYEDDLDKIKYSGTLKIRQIPDHFVEGEINWYNLEPINDELDNINFCYEWLDPDIKFTDVNIYLEPNEKKGFLVNVWLKKGVYAAKIYYLGKKDEEFWTDMTTFLVN